MDGLAGRDLDLRVGIRALPLSLVRIAAPDLALSGTIDGEADLRGPAERPSGRYALTVNKLVAPQTRQLGREGWSCTRSKLVSGAGRL